MSPRPDALIGDQSGAGLQLQEAVQGGKGWSEDTHAVYHCSGPPELNQQMQRLN